MSAPPNAGRRLFLKQTLFTTGLLAIGGGGAWAWSQPTYAVSAATSPRALSAREFAILSAWLDRLIPPGEGQPGAIAAGIPHLFDIEVSTWAEQHQSDFKQLLGLFEDFGLVLAGFPGRFTRMAPATQDRYLENWMTSGIQIKKEGFMVVKLIGQFLYYCQDVSWPMTGYPGPFDARFRRPAYDAIENQGA